MGEAGGYSPPIENFVGNIFFVGNNRNGYFVFYQLGFIALSDKLFIFLTVLVFKVIYLNYILMTELNRIGFGRILWARKLSCELFLCKAE